MGVSRETKMKTFACCRRINSETFERFGTRAGKHRLGKLEQKVVLQQAEAADRTNAQDYRLTVNEDPNHS